MWNPIASGSTDLWQHVWMYYSMPVEVEAAGGWTQNRRQASLKKTIRAHILQRRKDLKYTDKKQPLPPHPTSPPVWWHLMQQIETWSQSTELQLKRQKNKKGESKMAPDPHGVTAKFCQTDPVAARAEGFSILFLLLSCSIISPENWVTSSHPPTLPLILPSLHLHPSLRAAVAFADTKRSCLRHKPCC